MNSIPMGQIIGGQPGVLGTGGNPLSFNGVALTDDPSIPIGTVAPFVPGQSDTWFGAQSPEAVFADQYFQGFIGANSLPSLIYFVQYNEAAVSAYLRGGALTAVTLLDLQGFTGTLSVLVDGRQVTSPAPINLASATSYSNAATLMQTGLQATGNVWTGTLTTATSTTVTIDSTITGLLHVGDTLVGTDIPVGATIESFGTYTPTAGTGTVIISAAATGTVGPEAGTVTYLPTVTYDGLRAAFVVGSPTTGTSSTIGYISGTLAADVLLTQATGAVLSQGAAPATPAGVMNTVVHAQQNWVTFSTVFEATIEQALGFAAWVNGVSAAGRERFAYVEWDADTTDDTSNPPNGDSFGAQVTALAYNGVIPLYDLQNGAKAAFTMGFVASLDFEETQGSATLAFKGQAGLTNDVIDAATAVALGGALDGTGGVGNGYNYYGAFATAAQAFQWMQRGTMPGVWKFVRPYINQIAMNADFQLALATLAGQVKSIPYNTAGYNLVRGALQDPIQKYLNFGAIQPNIPLSASQIQQVNLAAGVKIDGILSSVGWYLQILPASPTVRGLSGSPPMTLWYTDGGSIQSLFLATIDVQ
jgi:hypothetical protein